MKTKAAPKTPKKRHEPLDDDIPTPKDGREFDALSDEDKEKVWNYYDRQIPLSETRPLTDAEWEHVKKAKKKMGRPRIGQGAKVVAVTLEKGFLKRVDAYARKHDLKRAELITKGLRIVIGEAQTI